MPTRGQRSGSRAEFEALLAPVLGPAYGMAVHLTRSREEAEDLVQEAALQAYSAFASFQPGTHFKAWLFKILINRFRYNYRKRKRGPEISSLDDAPELYLYLQFARAGLLGAGGDPVNEVIGRMSEEQIHVALAALPEEFRIVCTLYFMEELAYQEIAQIVECPVGTVRSRLHRGRNLLQKALWTVAQDHGVVSALQVERTGWQPPSGPHTGV